MPTPCTVKSVGAWRCPLSPLSHCARHVTPPAALTCRRIEPNPRPSAGVPAVGASVPKRSGWLCRANPLPTRPTTTNAAWEGEEDGGLGVWVGVGKGGEKMRYEGNVNNGMAVRRKAQSETENDLRTVRTVVHASQRGKKNKIYGRKYANTPFRVSLFLPNTKAHQRTRRMYGNSC